MGISRVMRNRDVTGMLAETKSPQKHARNCTIHPNAMVRNSRNVMGRLPAAGTVEATGKPAARLGKTRWDFVKTRSDLVFLRSDLILPRSHLVFPKSRFVFNRAADNLFTSLQLRRQYARSFYTAP